jgi:hypothetical protein
MAFHLQSLELIASHFFHRHAWADAKENANNYYNDDALQRTGVLWIMALLVVYGNNAVYVAEDPAAMRLTVATYMVLRFSQICFYALYSVASHHHRTQNRAYFLMILLGMCIWIPLLFESVSLRAKAGIAVVGIFYEVGLTGYPNHKCLGDWIADQKARSNRRLPMS